MNPLLQLRYWTGSTDGSMVLQYAYNLLNNSEFASADLLGNGFTRYAVNQFIPRNSPPQQSPPLYCEFDFFTDFYASSRSDMYVDNIVASVVPEPGSLLLAAIAGGMCILSRIGRGRGYPQLDHGIDVRRRR